MGHGPIGQVAEDLVKRGIRGVSEGVSKAVADFHDDTAKGLEAAARKLKKADASTARSFQALEHAGQHDVPRPRSTSNRAAATGGPVLTPRAPTGTAMKPGQVAYGSTKLSREVQVARLRDNSKEHNYSSARLKDGTIITGRSTGSLHAEEIVIKKAGGRHQITDIYSELEPCKNKCLRQTEGMNVTFSWQWNGADRGAEEELRTASQLAKGDAVKQLFSGRR